MRLVVHDYKHLKLKQDLLWVGTSTLVTVLFWIAYAVYISFRKDYSDPTAEKLTTPLNPNLDQELLQGLTQRYSPPENFTVLTIAEDESGAVSRLPQQTGSASNSATASSSGQTN